MAHIRVREYDIKTDPSENTKDIVAEVLADEPELMVIPAVDKPCPKSTHKK